MWILWNIAQPCVYCYKRMEFQSRQHNLSYVQNKGGPEVELAFSTDNIMRSKQDNFANCIFQKTTTILELEFILSICWVEFFFHCSLKQGYRYQQQLKKTILLLFPLVNHLPWNSLLDTIKASLRIIFANIWQVEIKGMNFIWDISFGNLYKLKHKQMQMFIYNVIIMKLSRHFFIFTTKVIYNIGFWYNKWNAIDISIESKKEMEFNSNV